MNRLPALDGLRGLAVLLVVAAHASNVRHNVLPGLDARGVGRSGVFLFFVLSSFLLTRQLLAAYDAGGPMRWGRFAARRLLRILPAYALALGVYVLLGAFEPEIALRHLALVRAEHHFWTIPVEVLFYLLLPVVTLGVGPLRSPWRRAGALVFVAAVARISVAPDYPARPPDYLPNVLPFLPVFLTGAALAALEPVVAAAPRARRIAALLSVVGLVALSPAVLQAATGEAVERTRFHMWFVPHAVLWSCVVGAASAPGRSVITRAFEAAPLRWVGRISYSVYLFHAAVLGYAGVHWSSLGLPGWTFGPLYLGAALLVGWASYSLVERPFLSVLRRGRAPDAQ